MVGKANALAMRTTAPQTKEESGHLHPHDGIAALFHEPLGGAGGSADADGVDAGEP